jgi:sulfoxide reductase heme-binding subunit YedZ
VILSEIALRFYLTIGAVVLVTLLALAATSTDGIARRLGGKRWRRLHYLAYPAGLLAIVHFFLQSKAGASEATVLAGLFLWLMAYRLRAPLSWPGLALLAVGAAIVTVLGEAAYFGLFTGVDPLRVLQANIALAGQRPGWIVLGIGLAVAVLAAARQVSVAPAIAEKRPVAAGR